MNEVRHAITDSSTSKPAGHGLYKRTKSPSWICHNGRSPSWITDSFPGVKNGYWVNLPMNAEVSKAPIITIIPIVPLSAMVLEFYWTRNTSNNWTLNRDPPRSHGATKQCHRCEAWPHLTLQPLLFRRHFHPWHTSIIWEYDITLLRCNLQHFNLHWVPVGWNKWSGVRYKVGNNKPFTKMG